MTDEIIKKPHGNKGRVRTPEQRARTSQVMRAYWSQDNAKSLAHKAWLANYASNRMKQLWADYKAMTAVSDSDESILKK